MAVKKASRIRTALRPMPLSELPIMKALMGLPAPPAGTRLSKRRPKEDPKTQLAQLVGRIIDKLQVLALRRPRALIIVAQVLDGLLKQQLDVLDDDLDSEQIARRENGHTVEGLARRKVKARPTTGHRGGGR
jgi:hypothetical protein